MEKFVESHDDSEERVTDMWMEMIQVAKRHATARLEGVRNELQTLEGLDDVEA